MALVFRKSLAAYWWSEGADSQHTKAQYASHKLRKNEMIEKVTYDCSQYSFNEILLGHFEWEKPLHCLHEWSSEYFPLLEGKERDQSSPIHHHFYSIFENEPRFLELYVQFIQDQVLPRYEDDLVYQAKPTFRIHYPENLAVGEWHRDSEYNHSRSEENWWVPFTEAYDSNTIWLESEEDKGDYKPYDVSPGEALLFPGSVLRHGNRVNDTGVSRVSMDFRVMPYSAYEADDAVSSAMGLQFKVGSYYALMKNIW